MKVAPIVEFPNPNFANATMPIEFLGFTVWIDSEEQELPEYEPQVEDENTVSCYIPSEVGKVSHSFWRPAFGGALDASVSAPGALNVEHLQEFRICWINQSQLNRCVVACYMDGRPVGGKPSTRTQVGGIEGVYTSTGTVRPFKFSPVVTTGEVTPTRCASS